jgi:hypothetical protein
MLSFYAPDAEPKSLEIVNDVFISKRDTKAAKNVGNDWRRCGHRNNSLHHLITNGQRMRTRAKSLQVRRTGSPEPHKPQTLRVASPKVACPPIDLASESLSSRPDLRCCKNRRCHKIAHHFERYRYSAHHLALRKLEEAVPETGRLRQPR